MKIKRIPFYEKHIKLIIFILVIIVTIALYKFYLANKIYSFELSIVYAFFLFIFSVISNLVANQVERKFFNSQEHLINLIKLRSILNPEFNPKKEYEKLRLELIHIKVFTTDNIEHKVKSYVNPTYFSYSIRMKKLIDEYDNVYSVFYRELNDIVDDLYQKNSISKHSMFCLDDFHGKIKQISSKLFTENSLKISNQDDFEEKLNIYFNGKRSQLLKIRILFLIISLKLYFAWKLVDHNIKSLNKIYGTRLAEDFERVNSTLNTIYNIEDELKKVKQIVEEVEDHVYNMEDNLNSINYRDNFEDILFKLTNIEDNIMDLSQSISNQSDS